jgi:hypothetical protein
MCASRRILMEEEKEILKNYIQFNGAHDIVGYRYNPKKYIKSKIWGEDFLIAEGSESEKSDFFKTRPAFHNLFEIIIDKTGIKFNKNLKGNVLCNPDCLELLLEKITKKYEKLFIFGEDTNLTEKIKWIEKLKKNFEEIYYEAKDINCSYVKALPMGCTYSYLIRNGVQNALEHINKSNKLKKRLAVSGFGSKWPKLSKSIKDRRDLLNFLKKQNVVDLINCKPTEYYNTISNYKYFLCPLGAGIQTPKLQESHLMGIIPVVTNHPVYHDLSSYGLPFLIVDKWKDVTQELLEKRYEEEFKNVDWNKVRKLYHADYFKENYID